MPRRQPEQSAAPQSRRCTQCGHWSAAESTRCERCGRRFGEGRSQARLGLEVAEGPPAPPDALPVRAEPEWKRELTRKLQGYRDRKKLSDERAKKPPAAELNRAGFSRPTRQQEAMAASGGAGGRRPAATPGDSATNAYLPPLRRDQPMEAPPRPALPAEVIEQELIEKGAVRAKPAPPPAPRRPRNGTRLVPASIGMRAVAGLMDLAIVAVALGVFLGISYFIDKTAVTGNPGARLLAVFFFVILAFYWVFYIRYLGRTAGMTWMGLRVVGFDGSQPSSAQLRSRALGTVLSAAALGIGFAWAAVDEQGYTWHDRISKTQVVIEDEGEEAEQHMEQPGRSRRLPPTARLVRRG